MAKSKELKNWFNFILHNQGYQFPGIFSGLITYSVIIVIYILLNKYFGIFVKFNIPNIFITVLGLVLGLLLVFRTNTAYDRWWEGRKYLADLMNATRNLAIKISTIIPDNCENEKKLLQNLNTVFPNVLKNHLRLKDYSLAESSIAADLLDEFKNSGHKPNFILFKMNSIIVSLFKRNILNDKEMAFFYNDFNVLLNCIGGCERIKYTPIPPGYSIHLKRILLIYLVTLPFSILNDLGWWTIFVSMLVFYIMVGIELLGAEIENPFGTDFNDLPFDKIESSIINNLKEIYSLNK